MEAKPDADRQRTGDERDLLQVEAEPRERERYCRDRADIAEDRYDRDLQAGLDLRARQELGFQPVLHDAGEDQQHPQYHRGGQERVKREVELADLETERNVADRVEQVGGGHFPRANDQKEREQDQHHPDERGGHGAAQSQAGGAHPEPCREALPGCGLRADPRKQRVRDNR